MNDHATLLLQVSVCPEIMVAGEEMNLHSHVCKLRYLTQKARVAFGHDITILVPEVEHVAEQINRRCLVLYAVKKPHEPAFLCAGVRYGP